MGGLKIIPVILPPKWEERGVEIQGM